MNRVDKRRVGAAFSRRAGAYDGRAHVQATVQGRVLRLVQELSAEAGALPDLDGRRRVLDIGAGTGALLARLAGARPAFAPAAVDLAPGMAAATLARVPRAAVAAGDAEALPFRARAFELVVSTSTFQWLPRLEPALAEARRVLAPGGGLVVALFGARTLRELKEAWRDAGGERAVARTHRFFDRDEVESAARAAGLEVRSVVEEELVERHADAREVLRSLKDIGANNAVPGAGAPRGLGGRRETLEMLRRYEERHGGPSGVPVTWHVVYLVARA